MVVVVNSRACRAQKVKFPSIAFQSAEADACSRVKRGRAAESDAAIGALSPFHETHGYCAYRISPSGRARNRRLIRPPNPNSGSATGVCSDAHQPVIAGLIRDLPAPSRRDPWTWPDDDGGCDGYGFDKAGWRTHSSRGVYNTVAQVNAAPSDRDLHIESAVDQAVHLNDKSKNTFRGQCKRVTHARVLPIYADVLKFSERVIADRAQRRIRDPRMPTVQHVLLDLCKRTIDENWKPSAQVMNGIVAVYNAHGVYP